MNPFDVLGIPKGSTVKVAKSAYRRLAMKYHPDRNKQDPKTAEEKFKAIKHAFELIEAGYIEQPPVQKQQQRPTPQTPPSPPEWAGWQSRLDDEDDLPYPKNTPRSNVDSQKQEPPKQKPVPKPVNFSREVRVTIDGKRILQAESVGPRSFLARVSVPDAMAGFVVEVDTRVIQQVSVPAGVPNNLQFVHELPDGDVKIRILMRESAFTMINYQDAKLEEGFADGKKTPILRTGTVTKTIVIGCADRYRNFRIESPDGSVVYVKPPAKTGSTTIKGKGYYDWVPSLNRKHQTRSDFVVNFVVNEYLHTTCQ